MHEPISSDLWGFSFLARLLEGQVNVRWLIISTLSLAVSKHMSNVQSWLWFPRYNSGIHLEKEQKEPTNQPRSGWSWSLRQTLLWTVWALSVERPKLVDEVLEWVSREHVLHTRHKCHSTLQWAEALGFVAWLNKPGSFRQHALFILQWGVRWAHGPWWSHLLPHYVCLLWKEKFL